MGRPAPDRRERGAHKARPPHWAASESKLSADERAFLKRICSLNEEETEKLTFDELIAYFNTRIARQSDQGGVPMPSHKFHIGETVMVKRAFSRNVPGGAYEVTKQLPHNGSEFEYRIKSANEDHERVARESELTKA
jgi:hypothetical protein